MKRKRNGRAMATPDRIRRAFLSGRNRPPELAGVYGVSEGAVLEALEGLASFPVKPSRVGRLLESLTRIRTGRVIIRNPHAVAEVNCSTAQMKVKDGWINMHAGQVHVHIRANHIHQAFFVEDTGHDRIAPACSVQFFAPSGESVFKFFLLRNSKGEFSRSARSAYRGLKKEFQES